MDQSKGQNPAEDMNEAGWHLYRLFERLQWQKIMKG
jgi:hypothetical protein